MQLLPKQKKHLKPRHITKLGILPETKKFGDVRYVKHATITSSKVEASQRVNELHKQGRAARKIKTKDGWAIYSRVKNV